MQNYQNKNTGQKITQNKYYFRIFLTFCTVDKSNQYQFFGNTYRSGNIPMKTGKNFYVDLEKPQYVYFIANSSSGESGNMALIEVLYIETTDDDRVISQVSEGWGLLSLNENSSGSGKVSARMYGGTPRNLFIKD